MGIGNVCQTIRYGDKKQREKGDRKGAKETKNCRVSLMIPCLFAFRVDLLKVVPCVVRNCWHYSRDIE